ncbi:hypothetical protein M514_07722 [Trichuris suis]|uniref:Uncharacterized protein n=1 Tax=Trichuris suis TaxID=68888 RepID=A0A085M271_9BILA|nr:hypothetical protein M513_07722 [Trichuris suis]KFD60385.1 hypothetical protein M514_07722 [Trichuris suis]
MEDFSNKHYRLGLFVSWTFLPWTICLVDLFVEDLFVVDILCWTICPGSVITGKLGLGVQNQAGEKLIEFCQGNSLFITNTLFQQPKRDCTREPHQTDNIEIKSIIYCAVSDGGAVYNQLKHVLALIADHIMSFSSQNSD